MKHCRRCMTLLLAFIFISTSGCSARPDCQIRMADSTETGWEWELTVPDADEAKLCLSISSFDNVRANPYDFILEQTLHSKGSRMQIQVTDDDTCPVHFSGDDWKAEAVLLWTPDPGWQYVTPLEQAELVLREPVPLLEFHHHDPEETDHSQCQIMNVQFIAPRDFIK